MQLGAPQENCSGKVTEHLMTRGPTLHRVYVRRGLLTSELEARIRLDLKGAHEPRGRIANKGRPTIKLQNKEKEEECFLWDTAATQPSYLLEVRILGFWAGGRVPGTSGVDCLNTRCYKADRPEGNATGGVGGGGRSSAERRAGLPAWTGGEPRPSL